MRGRNQVNKSLNTFHGVLAVWPPSSALPRRCENSIATTSWRRLSRGDYQTRPFGLQMKRWQQIRLFSYDIIARFLFALLAAGYMARTTSIRAGCEPTTLIRPLNLNGVS